MHLTATTHFCFRVSRQLKRKKSFQLAAFKQPSLLEQAGEIGVTAAKAQMPRVGRIVGTNVTLFALVGAGYSAGKCVAEGLTGTEHFVNSAFGGMCAGVMLGVHSKSPTVMLGASAGLALAAAVGDVNGRGILMDPDKFYKKSFGLRKPGASAELSD